MRIQSLNGAWQVAPTDDPRWYPATVPGGVHTDLLAAGQIPDPFVGDHERTVRWVAERDWVYRCVFELDPAVLAQPMVELVCAGLDTLAEVRLNGQPVGASDNMFISHRWAVNAQLRPGQNQIEIFFRSPVTYIQARQKERPMPGVADTMIPGGPYLRKAPSHFGWDWGPILPTVGIWRDIRLEGRRGPRLTDVHIHQSHTAGQVTVGLTLTVDTESLAGLTAEFRLTPPAGGLQSTQAVLANTRSLALEVTDPQLWWPNGLGQQPLYQAEVLLADADGVLDVRILSLGLRTIELRQDADAWGRSFQFVVNGVPCFAKGTNWIPADSFPTRIGPAQREHLLRSAAQANHNMIRVWGGGYYEDEHFYEVCDRLGLLVWQDFMFACAGYPLHDPDFVSGLREEVRQTVRRLRHRACLALWCGNNEMESGWTYWGWDTPADADLKAADRLFFYGTLAEWVQADDPDRAYWPSSPSSHTPHENPNSDLAGDNHLWEVWHALKPLRYYRERAPRFASEFGFQSLPAMATVAAFAEPRDWNMTSHVMEHHQRNTSGNGKIVTYLTQHYRLPGDFPSLVFLSQVLQAEAVRIGVEHWRRHPACAGALYWQLNDCWPVASWSSIDYYGRWKALHYASRRFFAPVLMSLEDDGPWIGVHLTNDPLAAWHGELHWSLQTLTGQVVDSGVEPILAPAASTITIRRFDFGVHINDATRRRLVFIADLWAAKQRLATSLASFVPDKHLELEDPLLSTHVTVTADEVQVTVTATTLARFVEVSLEGVDLVWSDNYFDLPAGRSCTLTAALLPDWSADEIEAAVRVRSLFDTFGSPARGS